MAVQMGGKGPYASTGSVLTVIAKHRQVGLRTVDVNTLHRIGVTEALAPRTLQTLILLDFYDAKGQITPAFDNLRKVSEQEFKPCLAELLKQAYGDVLTVLDPTYATPADVENAFRGFEPTGQVGRMVQLFIGLFTYVGVMPEGKARPAKASAAAGRARGRTEQKPSMPPPPPGEPIKTSPASAGRQGQGGEYSQTVALQTGGTMTLTVNVNPLSLRGSDREFFYKVADLLTDYDAAGDFPLETPAGAAQGGQEGR